MAKKSQPDPSIDHIMNLLQPSVSSGFLRGQLVIEGVLMVILRHNLSNPDAMELENTNYYRICSLCGALGLVDAEMLVLLRSIGRIRNKMAHQLDYELSFDEAFALAVEAARAGVDFSDDTIYSDKVTSREWYGVEGIVQELFQNLAQDLVYQFDPAMDGMFSRFH